MKLGGQNWKISITSTRLPVVCPAKRACALAGYQSHKMFARLPEVYSGIIHHQAREFLMHMFVWVRVREPRTENVGFSSFF